MVREPSDDPTRGRLGRRLLLGTVLAVAVFAALSIYADVDALGDRLGAASWGAVAAALGLAFANYLIRLVRWELYLRRMGERPHPVTSALVYFAGFSMAITPGKVGELLKAVLLRDGAGTPVMRTASVVIAERVTDLVSLVLLALAGAAAYGVAVELSLAGGAFVLLVLASIVVRPFAYFNLRLLERIGATRKLVPRLRELYENLYELTRPVPLAWGTALGVAAWLCECVGFALIVRGFDGASIGFGLAALIYSVTTVAGALSFLPGGLGVTEASMTILLVRVAEGVDEPTAVGATILTRLTTLWFAVLLGFLALALLRRLAAGRMRRGQG